MPAPPKLLDVLDDDPDPSGDIEAGDDVDDLHPVSGSVRAQSSVKEDRQSSVSTSSGCSSRRRTWFSRTRASIDVRMKQRQASSGVQTIGSPRTLNDVLTTTGQPVLALKAERIAW